MRRLLILLAILLLSTLTYVNIFAQELPLVYDVENTGVDCPIPYLPSFDELPSSQPLPDPFKWSDGRSQIAHFSDWRYRRTEIGAEIQHYEIGEKPVRPDTITASYSDGTLTVNVTLNNKTLTLTSQVILPAGTGPFPAVIGMNSPSGSIPSNIFSSRNIARITFSHNQVTTYSNPQNSDPYYQLYPNLNIDNTGQYSAWAWGVSRLIDGLELVQGDLPIDLHHLAVTGCSYAGKMALFAGAFDERIALTIAQESGGGGATSWRYSQSEPNGTVEKIDNTDYNWFMNSMRQFAGNNVWRMPEDHHELMAMVAPRALLVTANPDYTWLSNPSCYVCSNACQEVYNALGILDRFGYSIVGGHSHCSIPNTQIPEIEAFVDKFLLGNMNVNTNVETAPYSFDLNSWITWSTPTLTTGSSYFGTTSLVSPSNFQTELDTAVTFSWNNAEDAEKYFIQLSLGSSFISIAKSDSTTDTLITISNLIKGKKYFWRVRVKSADGPGPWSDVWNFSTAVSLPDSPLLISALLYSNREGWYTFTWQKVEYADQYLLQISEEQTFGSIFNSTSTADTTKLVSGLSGLKRYYWRVRADNIAGSGPWSEVGTFSTLSAPTNLILERTAANEITLTWKDNSTNEDGFVIERKRSTDTSFAVLDTVSANVSEFVDNDIEEGLTYTYRIKGYKESVESDYSNEVSLLITDVIENEAIPTEYSISQNYPNPFNPDTKINYSVPQVSFVTLRIFDALGREVAALVNEEKSPGNYEVIFNANDLSSGIYFYQLNAGNYVQIRKMILLK